MSAYIEGEIKPVSRLARVAGELRQLLGEEPHGSPLRYPLRVACEFAAMALEVAEGAKEPFMAGDLGSPAFDKIRECIGAAMASRLIVNFGGCRVYIPQPPRMCAHHALARLLGLGAAMQLARAFGGGAVKVPTGHWAVLNARNAVIRERYQAGETAAALAREFGLAEESVYRIAARASDGIDCQSDLFDGRTRMQWDQNEGMGHD